MNKAELENQIEVMQHFLNGGEVEYATKGCNRWSLATSPVWDWTNYKYRIKQEDIKYPVYAKLQNVKHILIVKFTSEKEGTVIEDDSNEYMIGSMQDGLFPVYNDAVWEILPDYEELTLYYEVIDTELGRYEVIGTLHTEEELKDFPMYKKTGRSFKLPRKG